VEGRKNWRSELQQQVSILSDGPRIWVHCASYGEFEQGRPLIERLKQLHPQYKIVLSFFSPSGYEAFKNYKGAELICYLPLDSKKSAEDFIEIIKPSLAIFVKYEFWLHYLSELKNRKIPTYLVSATFKPHHPFFKWYGDIFRKSLLSFNKIFLQDEGSVKLLDSIGIKNVIVAGDTRFDRVLEIKREFKGFDQIETFKGNSFLIIAGSTWPKDDDLFLDALSQLRDQNIKAIIVPHELDSASIKTLLEKISSHNLTYSLYSQGVDVNAKILVLDKMGMLARIYYHGDAAYIGGGLNDGIHNTLEPAVYGIPVFFYGNDYHKFNEAVKLVKLGAATNVLSATELSTSIKSYLNNKDKREEIRTILQKYFDQNTNVSQRILEEIDFS